MIFGRPADLVATAITALLNVLVLIASSMGVSVTPEMVAALNIAAGAVIAVLAFQPPTVTSGGAVNVQTPSGQPNGTATLTVAPSGDVTAHQT
jgi:hypothetical protein